MSLTVLAAVSAINDANMLITALAPLVHQAIASGQTEITDEDVAASRAKVNASIAALDALLARAKTSEALGT